MVWRAVDQLEQWLSIAVHDFKRAVVEIPVPIWPINHKLVVLNLDSR
jgi:hypothetical protein